jgi:hypothetical protein
MRLKIVFKLRQPESRKEFIEEKKEYSLLGTYVNSSCAVGKALSIFC